MMTQREQGRPAPAAGVRMLVLTGLFAALSCTATLVLQVPSPTGGYMNLGDTMVILGAYLLGPAAGAAAGGIGPALADMISGYAVYAPATLAIKACMALTAAALYRRLGRRVWGPAVCAAAAEAPMVAGYWIFDGLMMLASGGEGLWLCLAGAAAGIPSNLAQASFGVAASTALVLSLRKSRAIRGRFPALRGDR